MAVRWRIAILLAVITTINYIDRSVFGVVAPVIRKLFEIGDADYGIITSGFLFAYGIGQLLSGPVIDRFGTKRAFGLAALLWSLSTMLHSLGRGLWSFFAIELSNHRNKGGLTVGRPSLARKFRVRFRLL